jgi:hypothetical protein
MASYPSTGTMYLGIGAWEDTEGVEAAENHVRAVIQQGMPRLVAPATGGLNDDRYLSGRWDGARGIYSSGRRTMALDTACPFWSQQGPRPMFARRLRAPR